MALLPIADFLNFLSDLVSPERDEKHNAFAYLTLKRHRSFDFYPSKKLFNFLLLVHMYFNHFVGMPVKSWSCKSWFQIISLFLCNFKYLQNKRHAAFN